MRPVIVIWKDAHADCQGWAETSEIDDEPYLVRSIGFELVKGNGKKKGHISITQSISEDNLIDSVLHIPKRMVVSVAFLHLERDSDGETADEKGSGGDHHLPQDSKAKRV